jgi:hypothetical protein
LDSTQVHHLNRQNLTSHQKKNLKPKILDQTFSGYIFEFDGTISNTLPLHFHAWTKAMNAMNDFGGIFPEDLSYSWASRPTTTILGLINE